MQLSNKKFLLQFIFLFFLLNLLFYFIKFYFYEFLIFSVLFNIIIITLFYKKIKYFENFKNIWMEIGLKIGKFLNPILLSIIYFFIIFPYSLVYKFTNKKYIETIDKNNKTYWINSTNSKNNFNDMF